MTETKALLYILGFLQLLTGLGVADLLRRISRLESLHMNGGKDHG